jgi:hypothetical protein
MGDFLKEAKRHKVEMFGEKGRLYYFLSNIFYSITRFTRSVAKKSGYGGLKKQGS